MMKSPLSENKHSAFTDVAQEVFQSTLDSMFDKDIKVTFDSVQSGDPDDLPEGYESQVLILVTEEKTGMETGLIFKTVDITYLTNLMMMMDEPGKETMEDDDKDAIKELASQTLASLSVPLEEKTDVKLSFRVDDVMVNDAPALFQAEQYMIVDAKLSIGDTQTTFRFFTDLALMNSFGGGGEESGEPDFGEAFSFPDDDIDVGSDFSSPSSGSAPGNLDLLLDIDVPVSVKMGSTSMFLKDILTMGSGNVIELDESADEPVELVINNKVIARGEVVIVDGYFGFRIKEIVSRAERIKKLKD